MIERKSNGHKMKKEKGVSIAFISLSGMKCRLQSNRKSMSDKLNDKSLL